MMLNVVAPNYEIDPDTMKKLLKQYIKEVRGTTGKSILKIFINIKIVSRYINLYAVLCVDNRRLYI